MRKRPQKEAPITDFARLLPERTLSRPQKEAPKIGRPSLFTQELADELCARLAEGSSLRTVCRDDDMPDARTVFRWLRTNKEFCQQYARAKEEAADAMADEILDISDDGRNDWMTIWYGDNPVDKVNQEAVQRSKLRVEARKWLIAKAKPKKYGDKLDLTSGDKPILQENVIVFTSFRKNEAAG